MGYIIIDTEGTGLFQNRNSDKTTRPSDAPGQPRMAEFACVQLDDNFIIEGSYQQYVIPVGWENEDGTPMTEMPAEALEVNKLNFEFLRANGAPVERALKHYTDAVLAGRIMIGFNSQHDGRHIRAEIRHVGRRALSLPRDMPDEEAKAALKAGGYDDLFEQTLNICAMRSITTNLKGQVKKLNGKGGFPRLIDAAAHFGIMYPDDKRHTALEDAMVTAHLARILHEAGTLLPAEIHYAKGYDAKGGEA